MSGRELTADRLRELLDYDPETGVFTWRVSSARRVKVGAVAGAPRRDSYRIICISGRRYYAHRLAWLYVYGEWPADGIDHINCNGADNRLCNLRKATQSQNIRNARTPVTNTSGHKGVHWNKLRRRWIAQIKINGLKIHLGSFSTLEAAHTAYVGAAREHFGEFARVA